MCPRFSSSSVQDLLHAFTAFVKTSLIPQAGFGTFLIFQGTYKRARRAKTDAPRISVKQLSHLEPFKAQRLMATPTTKVKLKGSGLHPYDRKHLLALEDKRTIRVRLTGYNLQAECRTYFSIPPNNNEERVLLPATESPWKHCDGFAIRRTSSDGDVVDVCTYEADRHRRKFISERPIFLGLYGPLEKSRKYCGFSAERSHHVRVVDLKLDSILNVKAYIFCGEPNDWAFHTSEQQGGDVFAVGKCFCTIICLVVHCSHFLFRSDVTDDFTGQPCEKVKAEILMYGTFAALHCRQCC